MCQRLKKYIFEIRGLDYSKAGRELDEDKETVRTWCNGIVPRPDKVVKIHNWSDGYVEPNHFYDLTTETARANGPDPVPAEMVAA
jgi:hypothetical protein